MHLKISAWESIQLNIPQSCDVAQGWLDKVACLLVCDWSSAEVWIVTWTKAVTWDEEGSHVSDDSLCLCLLGCLRVRAGVEADA